MPFLMRFAAGLLTAATVVGCAGEPARKADGPVTPPPAEAPVLLETGPQKVAYAAGFSTAKEWTAMADTLDAAAFIAGVRDGFRGQEPDAQGNEDYQAGVGNGARLASFWPTMDLDAFAAGVRAEAGLGPRALTNEQHAAALDALAAKRERIARERGHIPVVVDLTDRQQRMSYAVAMDKVPPSAMRPETVHIDAFLRGVRAAYADAPAKLEWGDVADDVDRLRMAKPATGRGGTIRDPATASFRAGVFTAWEVRRTWPDADADTIAAAALVCFDGAPEPLTEDQLAAATEEYKAELRKRWLEGFRDRAESFLEQNRTRPGVKTTDSGLQYEVIKPGKGDRPGAGDYIVFKYHGELPSGRAFDGPESKELGFNIGERDVIHGWDEAAVLMKRGGKYRLFVPPDLAYGERGTEGIPPHAVLIYDVEVTNIIFK